MAQTGISSKEQSMYTYEVVPDGTKIYENGTLIAYNVFEWTSDVEQKNREIEQLDIYINYINSRGQ